MHAKAKFGLSPSSRKLGLCLDPLCPKKLPSKPSDAPLAPSMQDSHCHVIQVALRLRAVSSASHVEHVTYGRFIYRNSAPTANSLGVRNSFGYFGLPYSWPLWRLVPRFLEQPRPQRATAPEICVAFSELSHVALGPSSSLDIPHKISTHYRVGTLHKLSSPCHEIPRP